MDELRFASVFVKGPRFGECRELDTVPAALAFMLEHWSGDTGPKKVIALEKLMQAVAGNASAEDARVGFLQAAYEADLLASPDVSE
ncbi:DUF982 domain-containing protein [Phyllobacterium endophyticum]|uniref:DUF982 domain-containing protein n=1 Tax=Phyllobacterium endophyticum TaxID=1149773 RepID=A0A2P7ARA1_9HYPH|nr:DUF982 domain-containing protein [Phyllobacterium endophyticum]MBB3237358.1 hypothetical protein [Phyllobacterium endophyticum]PSH56710.1 hypothetical protein CU100_15270 [Phyllobacterium endophyticum]TYR44306.1 DUF982 domain-containing protein [Phyllobacterium endophyticum]